MSGSRWIGLFFAVLAIVVLHGVLFYLDVSPAPRGLVGDEGRYLASARELVETGRFERDAMWPPFYVYVVAACLRLSGGSLLVVWVVQTLLLVALALLIGALARAWLGEGPHVIWAGVLPLLDPTLGAFAHYLWPEIVHAVLLAFAFWILAVRRERLGWCALFGLALGLALSTKSLLLPFVPVLLAAVAWKTPARRAVPRLALALLGLAAAIAPTAIGSYRANGTLGLAGSSRFNLWLGLTDSGRRDHTDRRAGEALAEYRASGTTPAERDRFASERIRAVIAERGLGRVLADQLGRQYFRLFSRHSALTDQLPGGVLAQRGRGYTASDGPIPRGLALYAWTFHAALLAGFTLALATTAPPARQPWWWAALAFLAYNLALFFFLHVKSRYRIQLEPYFLLWVGCGFGAWWVGSKYWPHASRPRVFAGAIAALLLLGLAFAGG